MTAPRAPEDAFRGTAGKQDDQGVPVFRVAPDAPPITSEDVQKALSEWP